jgi:hypothetical protein
MKMAKPITAAISELSQRSHKISKLLAEEKKDCKHCKENFQTKGRT